MHNKKIISLSGVIICLLLLLVVSFWTKDRKVDAACLDITSVLDNCRVCIAVSRQPNGSGAVEGCAAMSGGASSFLYPNGDVRSARIRVICN